MGMLTMMVIMVIVGEGGGEWILCDKLEKEKSPIESHFSEGKMLNKLR